VTPTSPAPAVAAPAGTDNYVQFVIQQQMALMAQQLALLQGVATSAPLALPTAPPAATTPVIAGTPSPGAAPARDSAETAGAESAPLKYDVKTAFGAIARIHTTRTGELTERQRARLDAFMRRYVARTRKSKEYTIQHRPHLADPRVVNGFRPQLKEIIYQIVIERSKGAHLWDLDGNDYVDALNGFGMSLFGWQPPFVTEAVRRQLDAGYDIGPQHPLAGDVAKLVCEFTGFDRAGLCNTGSEAVMGTVRIARTVTGRSKIVIFSGAYHGIFDEVIVRGTRKLRSLPAAPGIMPNTSENVMVLEYGTPETLEIIRANADEIAAVLVEPVQSRRPDFQPRDFLRDLRELTEQAGIVLVFDEVVTGFRCHPGGIQALWGIRADLASYGKVLGGGFPIGVIAGKRDFMDALDGGGWQYGDDSVPSVGVTYFAGTFVRHPLALAAAKASLEHMKHEGPELQAQLTLRTAAMADELNAFCREVGAPIVIKHFSSVWKTFFTEDHPLQDLLFAMMRSRGVHILDNFPCFFTTAHTDNDLATIKKAFKESVAELQEADFIPRRTDPAARALDAASPPVPGARLGRDADGKPAWFVPNPDAPGKYVKVS
jgi:glutamate-1-semialdehyde aminotransferase